MDIHVTFKTLLKSSEILELAKSRGFSSIGEYVAFLVKKDAEPENKVQLNQDLTINLNKDVSGRF